MYKKKNIENAVCEYFKVNISDVYKARKSKYPYNGAKIILMYLLFANGYKSYDIAEWFGFTTTMVYRHCGEAQTALKSDSRIKQDIEEIINLLKK